MLALKKHSTLQQYVIYITSTVTNLRACKKLLGLNKNIELSNLFSRRHRVISVRAPKHFNIGKHQFILKKYYLRLSARNLNTINASGQVTNYKYQKSIPIVRLPPTQKITHTKVSLAHKFQILM